MSAFNLAGRKPAGPCVVLSALIGALMLGNACTTSRPYRDVPVTLSVYPQALANEHCPPGRETGCYHWGYFGEWKVNCRQELGTERPPFKGCVITPRPRPDPEPWRVAGFPSFGLSITPTHHWWAKISTHYYHEPRPAVLIEVRGGVYRTLRRHGRTFKDWQNETALQDIDKVRTAKSIRIRYRDESGQRSDTDYNPGGFSRGMGRDCGFHGFRWSDL